MTEPHTWVRVFDDSDSTWMCLSRSGRCEVEKFIDSLPLQFSARLQRWLELHKDGHHIKSPENIRSLGRSDGVSVLELKPGKYRIYVIDRGGCWHLTHGRPKPKDSKVSAEVRKALSIDQDCEDRAKGHCHGAL